VNASDINAFALPGGYLYFNRGLIEAAKNEGQLAGVMAHEIAHVALRHGTNQASKGLPRTDGPRSDGRPDRQGQQLDGEDDSTPSADSG